MSGEDAATMNLLKIFERKPAATESAGSPSQPATNRETVTSAPKSPVAVVTAPAATRYTALTLVEDELLERQLYDLFAEAGQDWAWEKAGTVACARQLLNQRKFSLVITQGRIQNQPVVELLNEIHNAHPGMLRYFYGAPPPKDDLGQLQGMRPAVISSKNHPEMIISQFERELMVESWLSNKQTRELVAQFRHLPSLPTIYNQVVAELESPTGSFDEVARLIGQDPLMTAKILQLVNSAIFALSTPVTKAEEAVLILGAERTKALLLAVPVFTRFNSENCPGLSPDQLWQHSMEVATFARAIALKHKAPTAVADAAFTAGLLHDVGKLLLAANLPDKFAELHRDSAKGGLADRHAEQLSLGTTHAETAACLLGMWGLPLPVVEAVAHHHHPSRSEHNDFTPLTAVHAANTFYYEKRMSTDCTLDTDYLKRANFLDHRNQWRAACGLEARPEEASLLEKIRLRQQARDN